MKTYPIFLVGLDTARCVVVGGGAVAARKVAALREADARIVVISPKLCEPLERLAVRGRIDVIRRPYRAGDLEGASLVVAATDDTKINEQVWREAKARNLLINVVDDPEHCSFIASSVVRRGPLSLAISTSGRCPALSQRIRKELEEQFGPSYRHFVVLLGEVREKTVDVLSLSQRRRFWKEIFESNILSLLANGQQDDARRRAEKILERYIPENT